MFGQSLIYFIIFYSCHLPPEVTLVKRQPSLTLPTEISKSTETPALYFKTQKLSVLEGTVTELSCEPELSSYNDKRFHLQWFENEKKMDRSEPSLLIHNVSRSMSGSKYKCTIYNGTKPYEYKDMILDVIYPPIVHVSPKSIVVDRSGSFNASCFAQANPVPIIKWYFQQHPTYQENDIVYVSAGKNLTITALDLTNCRYHDRNLTCMATNNITVPRGKGNSNDIAAISSFTDQKVLPIKIRGCENVLYIVTRTSGDKDVPWILMLFLLLLLLVLLILLLFCMFYVKRRKSGRRGYSASTTPNERIQGLENESASQPILKDKPKEALVEPSYRGIKDIDDKHLSEGASKILPSLAKNKDQRIESNTSVSSSPGLGTSSKVDAAAPTNVRDPKLGSRDEGLKKSPATSLKSATGPSLYPGLVLGGKKKTQAGSESIASTDSQQGKGAPPSDVSGGRTTPTPPIAIPTIKRGATDVKELPPSPPAQQPSQQGRKKTSSLVSSLASQPWTKLFIKPADDEPPIKGLPTKNVDTHVPEIYEARKLTEEPLISGIKKIPLSRTSTPIENIITDDPTAIIQYPKVKTPNNSRKNPVSKSGAPDVATTKGL